MKKKMLYIWSEFKHSSIFNTFVVLETVICIILLCLCLHAAELNKANSQFYNGTVANTSYVSVGADGMTVAELKERVGGDLSDFGTSAAIEVYMQTRITIVTPALVKSMPALGLRFSKTLPDGYREAYVNEVYKGNYKKGEYYDLALDDDGAETIRVKVMGYTKEMLSYYVFNGMMVTGPNIGIYVCDNLRDDMTVYAGFFFNGNSPAVYKDMGLSAKLGKDLYNENTMNRIINYLAVIILLIMITSIFCNYMLNLDRLKKRYAIQHITGIDSRTIIASECIKMAAMYVLAAMIALIVAICVIETDTSELGTMSYVSYISGALIVLGLYAATVACGVAGLIKVRPLEAIKDESNE